MWAWLILYAAALHFCKPLKIKMGYRDTLVKFLIAQLALGNNETITQLIRNTLLLNIYFSTFPEKTYHRNRKATFVPSAGTYKNRNRHQMSHIQPFLLHW